MFDEIDRLNIDSMLERLSSPIWDDLRRLALNAFDTVDGATWALRCPTV